MKWYDFFSGFYDSSLEKLYYSSRKKAVELLDLKDGHTVLDVACGTGANFTHLKSETKSIILYATDYSEGMLNKAKANVLKNNWDNVYLFQSDARLLTPQSFKLLSDGAVAFDRIICVLGLSVIPDWENVMDNLISLLKPDGKIVVVDVYAEKRTLNTWLVEKVAKANLDRKIWQTLKNKTANFYMEYLPVKESKVGGKLFAAVGTKNQ